MRDEIQFAMYVSCYIFTCKTWWKYLGSKDAFDQAELLWCCCHSEGSPGFGLWFFQTLLQDWENPNFSASIQALPCTWDLCLVFFAVCATCVVSIFREYSYMQRLLSNLSFHWHVVVCKTCWFVRAIIVLAKVVKKGGQIMLTAKAYNGRVILEWLSRCLQDCAKNHDDERLALLSSCACLALKFSTVQVIHVYAQNAWSR